MADAMVKPNAMQVDEGAIVGNRFRNINMARQGIMRHQNVHKNLLDDVDVNNEARKLGIMMTFLVIRAVARY